MVQAMTLEQHAGGLGNVDGDLPGAMLTFDEDEFPRFDPCADVDRNPAGKRGGPPHVDPTDRGGGLCGAWTK